MMQLDVIMRCYEYMTDEPPAKTPTTLSEKVLDIGKEETHTIRKKDRREIKLSLLFPNANSQIKFREKKTKQIKLSQETKRTSSF